MMKRKKIECGEIIVNIRKKERTNEKWIKKKPIKTTNEEKLRENRNRLQSSRWQRDIKNNIKTKDVLKIKL